MVIWDGIGKLDGQSDIAHPGDAKQVLANSDLEEISSFVINANGLPHECSPESIPARSTGLASSAENRPQPVGRDVSDGFWAHWRRSAAGTCPSTCSAWRHSLSRSDGHSCGRSLL